MHFFRLIKPIWAQDKLANDEPNPKFERSIAGPKTIESNTLTEDDIKHYNQLGYNVYWFPNHPSDVNIYTGDKRSLSGSDIDVFNYCFIDMDLKDGVWSSKQVFLSALEQFPIKPTMVVDSGNGIHAYWQVSDLKRNSYVLLNLALSHHFRTDPSIWTVMQLMRYPGTLNTKVSDDFKMTTIDTSCSSGKIYKVSDFPQWIFDIPKDLIEKGKNHLRKLDGDYVIPNDEDVDYDNVPEKFLDFIETNGTAKTLFENPSSIGDRSKADCKLCGLLRDNGFTVKESLAVIANTQKAKSKQQYRIRYAQDTVELIYAKKKSRFKSAADFLKEESSFVKEDPVSGPSYMDTGVLVEPWRKKELLGIIAGSGVGKTAVALNIIRDMIKNNPQNDDVYVFFSLEMTKREIISRWIELVQDETDLASRLYVVDTLDEKGDPFIIGLQEMYDYCKELKDVLGVGIGAIVVDHFHLISTHIDTSKKPDFGINSEIATSNGVVRNMSSNTLASQLKVLVKLLDTFGIILTQTTKEKGGGDYPIGKDGAYGISQYEWIMSRIITLWQPLMRIQNQLEKRFLAFQYVKIREKRKEDKIMELDPVVLTYEIETGKLRVPHPDEYEVFCAYLPRAAEAREAANKKQTKYRMGVDLQELEEVVQYGGSDDSVSTPEELDDIPF